MKRLATGLLLLAIIAPLFGQQPNIPARAVMKFNNVDGPPYPLTGVAFPRGPVSPPNTVTIEGLPNSPFIVCGANSLVTGVGLPYYGGYVDLNLLSGFSITGNGLTNPFWTLSPAGQFTANLPISSTTPIGAQRVFQTMVADFTSPYGATLTAATQIVVAAGVTVQVQNVGSNAYVPFSLSPFNFQVPFYATNYSTFYINQDGSVGFNMGSGDYTPTPTEFLVEMPRIAGYWTDLEPGGNSVIQVQINQSVPQLQYVQVDWINMMEWAGGGTPHTFSIRIYAAPVGDIQLVEGLFNNAAQYEILVGLSPGGNVSTHPQKNLSTMGPTSPIIGCPNENFHEWFGLTSFPYYTAGFNNPWDLTGRTLTFQRYYYNPPFSTGCPSGTQAGWGYIAF